MDTKSLKNYSLPVSALVVSVLIAGAWMYTAQLKVAQKEAGIAHNQDGTLTSNLQENILSMKGVVLPIVWGDLGVKMIKAGVVDKGRFENLYIPRGGLSEADKKLLESANNGNLIITPKNSGVILNMLWAFGLGNKNPILENGPMMTYSGAGLPAEALAKAGNFASTGGWTLSKGDSMNHYSMHSFITLTPRQQALVEKISQGIFRPCCNNSTYFPDCNHGMAMLGLLELMASQDVSEQDMWKTALIVNSYWFPDTYMTIATYMKDKGIEWKDINPQEILGADYSSASGFQKVLSQIQPQGQKGGASCGA